MASGYLTYYKPFFGGSIYYQYQYYITATAQPGATWITFGIPLPRPLRVYGFREGSFTRFYNVVGKVLLSGFMNYIPKYMLS